MKYLQLIRFKNLFIIALLQILLRYALLIPILRHYGIEPVLTDQLFSLLVLGTLLFAASGYIINDYFDLRIDRINKPQKVIVGKHIKRRQALFLHVLLTAAGVFIWLFIGYVARKENYALIAVGVPILLWYYSTTFKKQAVLGNLIISFFTALVAYTVVSAEFAMLARAHGAHILMTEACSSAWFWTTGFAFFAFITNFSREIIKDAEDIKGDKAVGCKTLPISLGLPLTKAFLIVLELASVIALWLIYWQFSIVREIPYVIPYFVLALTIPYLILIWIIYTATSAKHFHRASTVNKIVMFMGILLTLLAGQVF